MQTSAKLRSGRQGLGKTASSAHHPSDGGRSPSWGCLCARQAGCSDVAAAWERPRLSRSAHWFGSLRVIPHITISTTAATSLLSSAPGAWLPPGPPRTGNDAARHPGPPGLRVDQRGVCHHIGHRSRRGHWSMPLTRKRIRLRLPADRSALGREEFLTLRLPTVTSEK